METYYRDTIVRLLNKNHDLIKQKIENFYSKQRDFQFKLEIYRSNWFLNDEERSSEYRLEYFRTRINTVKNLQEFKNETKNLDLSYKCLLKLLSEYMIVKYKKSNNSLYKFLTKLSNNQVKTLKEKKISKIKKKINIINIKKTKHYKKNILNINLSKQCIQNIKKLPFTTQKSKINRNKLISELDKIIGNNQLKFEFKNYVNYIPDHIYHSLIKLQ